MPDKRGIYIIKSQKANRFIVYVFFILTIAFLPVVPSFVYAITEEGGVHNYSFAFLWMAVVLILAKLFSSAVEKLKQPSVMGELMTGIFLGNLAFLGIFIFEPIKNDPIINFLAELGAIILLFQTGLESNIQKILKVGSRALFVACIGVIAPFVLGTFIIGPALLSNFPFNTHLFLGIALTATSVGITARIFQDFNKLHTQEAQIILGAAVIDDILALIILAAASSLVSTGILSFKMIIWITAKSALLLGGAILLGQFFASQLGKLFAKIHTGTGMKLTLAISLGLIFAYLSHEAGLSPIVGAFAAGLILDPVHFRYFKDPKIVTDIKNEIKNIPLQIQERIYKVIEPHAERHIEDLIKPISHFLVPFFFVVTGLNVKFEIFLNPSLLATALVITLAAFIGKIVSGLAAGKANKLIVGVGMVPRGEVGLIFAMTGKSLGIISDEILSVLVIMVILSTLLTPLILSFLLRKNS